MSSTAEFSQLIYIKFWYFLFSAWRICGYFSQDLCSGEKIWVNKIYSHSYTVHYVYPHFFYSDFVYPHFVYSKHRSWVLVRTASNRARDLCFEQKLRKIKIFHLKITIFTGLTSAVYFNYASGHVIAMLFIANRLPKIKEKFSFKIRRASH